MFESPPAVRPLLAAVMLLAVGVYVFFGGLALVEAGAPAIWPLVLVPLAVVCFAGAAFETVRLARSPA
jgi:hypothetical protein